MAQLNTFEKYTKNNTKVSEQKALAYLNFIRYTRKIVLIKLKKKNNLHLPEKIKTTPLISERSWLISKLKEIGK